MNDSADIGQQRRTFLLEVLRSVPQGFIETSGTTFAMYVAIRVFDVPVGMKMMIAAAGSLGLLLSLFTVQIVRRLGCSVNVASVVVWSGAGVGFATAALSGDSAQVYVVGVCVAAMLLMVGMPLMSQIYRKHYPNKVRGKLFSIASMVKAVVGGAAGLGIGVWLTEGGSDFHGLFWFYSGCCLLMAVCVLLMAQVKLRRTQALQLFDAFSHVSGDAAFRKLLISWMMLGLGNLLCFALFVEFITNSDYGFALDAKRVGVITSTIPMLAVIVCVVPWGMVFDRLPFYRVRVMVNGFFLIGMLIYYLGGSYFTLCLGMIFHGIGRSGGNVLWSLWVTRFSNEENVGEYMSVHTCFTGLRGTLAPVIAFSVAGMMGPATVALAGAALVIISSLILIPEMRAESKIE